MAKRKIPSPITILVIIIMLAAVCTWVLPSGEYNKLSHTDKAFSMTTQQGAKTLPFTQHTLDSLHIRIPLQKFENDIRKPVAVPGTYHRLPANHQGVVAVAQSPIKGIYDTIDIVLFVLFIGGFMQVFQLTGAMEQGIRSLSHTMKGREAWLLVILGFLFACGGASYGMAEEGMMFYPVLVPLFLAAGYDLLVPVAVIYGGTSIGNIASFSNPFATIIASNAAGISWTDGIGARIALFVIISAVLIVYTVRYAQKVKKDPTASLVYQLQGNVESLYPMINAGDGESTRLTLKQRLLLILFALTFGLMIYGVIFQGWWLAEMSALFMVSGIIVAIIGRINEGVFIKEFIKGAEGMLSVCFIIGVARAVTMILNDGQISDTILYYAAGTVGHMSPIVFIVVMFLMFNLFTLFIPSSSGMAVLTMPIFGSLAVIVGVPSREIVNAYLYGMGVMSFITPTGLMLPSLAMANINVKVWLRFVWPLLLIISVICLAFLVAGVKLG